LAALRDDQPARVSLRQRVDTLETIKRARAGSFAASTPEQIISLREWGDDLRSRSTVTNATGAVVPQWTRDTIDLPGAGGRVVSLFRVREAPEAAIGVSEETGTPSAVVAPTDFGTALPESAATYTRTDLTDSRFGAFIPASRSVLDDSQALADAIDFVLTRD